MARGADGEAVEGCGGAVEAVEGRGEGRGSGGGGEVEGRGEVAGQGDGGRAVGKMARREFLRFGHRLAPPPMCTSLIKRLGVTGVSGVLPNLKVLGGMLFSPHLLAPNSHVHCLP